MIETNSFYRKFYSETKTALVEVEHLLQRVDIEFTRHKPLDLLANGTESNPIDSVMLSYLQMIEVTRTLEDLLDKVRSNDIAFNGHISSLVEAIETLNIIMCTLSSKHMRPDATDT